MGPGCIPGLDGFIHTREQPSRRPSWKTLPRKSDRGAFTSGGHVGSVASLRAGSVTLTDEIPNILQGLQQCSITIYQRSKLSVTVSLHHPGPVFVGGAKKKSSRA